MESRKKINDIIHNSKAIGRIILVSKKSSKDNDVKDIILSDFVLDHKKKKTVDKCSMGIITEAPV